MTTVTECAVESDGVYRLSGLGGAVAHGPDISPGTPGAERGDYGQADDFIGK